MTTTQLVGVITLVGTILIAGLWLGRLENQVAEHGKRLDRIEGNDEYFHGSTNRYTYGKAQED